MSVFSKIFDKIFHRNAAATTTADAGSGAAPSYPSASDAATAGAAAQQQQVDVEAVLNGLAAKNSQKLNWRTSIVDLMKLLDLDSSLQERKDLATELGYTGAKDGSAEMNLWLHKQVMNKLAANGGKVPADLKD
jgi:Domain of unknown function (DUF3597)